MKKKIKITEDQLKHLLNNKKVNEELDIDELGVLFIMTIQVSLVRVKVRCQNQ